MSIRDLATGEPALDIHKRQRTWIDDLPRGGDFDLDLLPTSGSMAYLAQRQAEQRGLTVTADVQQFAHRRMDAPLTGKIALMSADARTRRDLHDKPLMLADFRAGKVPTLFIGGGNRSLEELSDMADEYRHYGWDVANDVQPVPQATMQADWHKWTAQAQDAQSGRKRFAYDKRKGLATGKEWL